MQDSQVAGQVFNVQSYSVHDGPGIRTVVFFKGCPLRCSWCSNPESQKHMAEIAWNKTLCIGCKSCLQSCRAKALSADAEGIRRDEARCLHCETCIQVCPSGAMFQFGEARSVESLLEEVEGDSAFYSRSRGGITLSGGEPLFQPRFAMALLREAKKRHVHRAIETCAFCDESIFLEACGLLDYLLVDVKSLNEEKHKKYTGQGNKKILANIQAAASNYPRLPIHVRTPVIPGFNDSEEDIAEIARFAKSIGASDYSPLEYHKMGSAKYAHLQREYPMGDIKLEHDRFATLEELARQIVPGARKS